MAWPGARMGHGRRLWAGNIGNRIQEPYVIIWVLEDSLDMIFGQTWPLRPLWIDGARLPVPVALKIIPVYQL